MKSYEPLDQFYYATRDYANTVSFFVYTFSICNSRMSEVRLNSIHRILMSKLNLKVKPEPPGMDVFMTFKPRYFLATCSSTYIAKLI